jgi:hypothetical protein
VGTARAKSARLCPPYKGSPGFSFASGLLAIYHIEAMHGCGAWGKTVRVMTAQARLIVASVVFALLWTLGMIWWTGTQTANIVITSIAGVVAGVVWYFAMRWWQQRHSADR